MWRAFALAVAIACSATSSLACEDPYNIDGIVYDAVPADTPSSALVLDVEFDPAVVAHWRGGIIEARVRRVVQGDFTGERVRVGIMNNSCLWPFIYGTQGLIIGEMREGFEEFTTEARAYPSGERRTHQWRIGFEGVWFQPKGESIYERRERTGVDILTRPVNLTPIDDAPSISGDYDGDGDVDTAAYYETDEGELVVAVEHTTPDDAPIIWGGDIASLPYFVIRTAPPGLYQTDCDAYGSNCGGAPRTVTLTHDGIIVQGLEDHSRTLFYWSDGEFQNVSVRE
ncbi:MAG: hypothetical protein KF779_03480 [Hyphomonadaceae bacterium]|nr:hypothetical protein [Hyphomonadaceae bacterium]